MSKYKYTKNEQQLNNVLKYHDKTLADLADGSEDRRNRREAEIEFLEEQLRAIGIEPFEVKKQMSMESPKKVMIYPAWEKLCREAEAVVGTECELEALFTVEELKKNEQEIRQMNAEYNQLHHLDRVDIAISAIAARACKGLITINRIALKCKKTETDIVEILWEMAQKGFLRITN